MRRVNKQYLLQKSDPFILTPLLQPAKHMTQHQPVDEYSLPAIGLEFIDPSLKLLQDFTAQHFKLPEIRPPGESDNRVEYCGIIR